MARFINLFSYIQLKRFIQYKCAIVVFDMPVKSKNESMLFSIALKLFEIWKPILVPLYAVRPVLG